jgi:mycothiol synthase
VSSAPIEPTASLTPEQADAVRGLLERARRVDGVAAVSEAGMLALAAPGPPRTHLLGYAAERLTGYAQLDLAEASVEEASVELVVDPEARRHGMGTSLWEAVAARAPGARVWAHGDLAPARAFAEAHGLARVRELLKLSRPLSAKDAQSADAALPSGFSARAFEPGRDEDGWLEANRRAFAHHPEQGRLTRADLEERMAQPWFDPFGFILVEDSAAPGRIAGFHWTKVDPGERSRLDPGSPAGEVYVVGVHPAYQGRGLARPLTALGLAHLARLGLPEVVLYVDGDNEPAVKTYTRLGFRPIMVDVMYSRGVHPAVSG